MAAWRAIACDRDGTQRAELQNAEIGSFTEELNESSTISLTLPSTDQKAVWLTAGTREVKLLRDGVVRFRGPITRVTQDKDAYSIACRDPLFYLGKRFVGKADRTNLLLNPGFESGLTNWTAFGVTAAAVTSHRFEGAKGAMLTQANAGQDTFLRQQVVVTSGSIGTVYTLAGWVHIHSDYAYTGTAFDERGLFVERIRAGVLQEAQWDRIDDSFRPSQSYRQEITIYVPPNVTETISVRLYGIGGRVTWDAVTLTVMESLSFSVGTDIASIAQSLVTHAQDTAFGKSSVGLLTSCPATGRTTNIAYQFADHPNILAAIQDLSNLGMDFSVESTSTTRTFTTYASKGSTKNALPVAIGRGIVDFTYSEDLPDTANSVITLGDGDGPDREEGYAGDTSTMGGLVLEEIINTPAGTPIDVLDAIAATNVTAKKNVARVLEVTLGGVASEIMRRDLRVGDRVPVRIPQTRIPLNELWRVMRLDHSPQEDLMSVSLNP